MTQPEVWHISPHASLHQKINYPGIIGNLYFSSFNFLIKTSQGVFINMHAEQKSAILIVTHKNNSYMPYSSTKNSSPYVSLNITVLMFPFQKITVLMRPLHKITDLMFPLNKITVLMFLLHKITILMIPLKNYCSLFYPFIKTFLMIPFHKITVLGL